MRQVGAQQHGRIIKAGHDSKDIKGAAKELVAGSIDARSQLRAPATYDLSVSEEGSCHYVVHRSGMTQLPLSPG